MQTHDTLNHDNQATQVVATDLKQQKALLNQLMIQSPLKRKSLVFPLTSFWVLTITYEYLHVSHRLFVLFCCTSSHQNRSINTSDMVDFIEKDIIQKKFGRLFLSSVKFKSFQFENKTTSQTTGEVFCWSLKGEQTGTASEQRFAFQLCVNNNPNQMQTLSLWGVPKEFEMWSTSTYALMELVNFAKLFTQELHYEDLVFQCVGHRQRIPYFSQGKNEHALKQTTVTHAVPEGFIASKQ
jgi:hypothetical protein